MLAARGPTIAEIDRYASEADAPYGTITVDCSNPHEFDDAISVEALPSAQELYKVSVFAVDTSSYYNDDSILRGVLRKTESLYMNPNTPVEDYQPMLPSGLINKLHFSRSKKPKNALCVSFLIGENQPPTDITIGFGQVEVRKNFSYKRFGEKCRYSPSYEKFGRASAYILSHLRGECGPEETYQTTIHVPKTEHFRRGANINQSFMVAAGFLVASQLSSEHQSAVYRVHDPVHSSMATIFSPKLAYFSSEPGRHLGLGLRAYTRVTSPLRRAEDFVMHGLLRQRSKGNDLTNRDHRIIASTIQRLNQRIAAEAFMGAPRLKDEDLWTISEEEAAEEIERMSNGLLGRVT